jgi:hypothetical protein
VLLRGLFNKDSPLTASIESEKTLEKAVRIHPLDATRETTEEGLKILLQVDLNALKPLTKTCVLVITDSTSKWKFQAKFDVSPPPLDDEICIETQLDVVRYVSFPLSNIYESFDEFRATLVDEPGSKSATNLFTVSPMTGVFGPASAGPTLFTVSFRPKEYGRMYSNCKLIIQTEHVYWSFLLKGSLPTYIPPKMKSRLGI